MKKQDVWLIAILLIVFLLAGAFISLFSEKGEVVDVSLNGETFGTYNLNEERTVNIGEGNILSIINGKASMTYANCPDQICVGHSPIGDGGEAIICLPNKVIVSVKGK